MALWLFIVTATFSIGYPTPLSFRNFHIIRMEKEVKCVSDLKSLNLFAILPAAILKCHFILSIQLADSKFYTPRNVKDKCIKGVMECFSKELNTAKWECEDKNNRISEAPSIPDECTCESYPQTDFKDFLNEYKTWIQSETSVKQQVNQFL
uniref:Interleukin n=1 Tax=Nothobranchius furzeri TaxID=105023 RepID=A0A8C6NX06_NOTFU